MLHVHVLHFTDGPSDVRIDPPSPSVTLVEGEDLSQRLCVADCNPSCSFSWHFGHEKGSLLEASYRLKLENVSREMHGRLFCNADNEINPTAYASFDLVVYCQ